LDERLLIQKQLQQEVKPAAIAASLGRSRINQSLTKLIQDLPRRDGEGKHADHFPELDVFLSTYEIF